MPQGGVPVHVRRDPESLIRCLLKLVLAAMNEPLVVSKIRAFFQFEAAAGVLLIAATVVAMVVENSSLRDWYDSLLLIPVEIRFGDFEIAKPLLLWVNDGLMAVFFFLVGLELKREVLAGELSDPSRVVLPVLAAIGGMAVPAIIYSVINWGDAIAMKGWAIPSATDIAFALGVLALLGSRVPNSLKLFLMTLAIVDDLGAIIIIAIFYTADLSLTSLAVATGAIVVIAAMNRAGVLALAPYLLVTVVLWSALLKSGVHATLAGVIAALFIPYRREEDQQKTQLERLEHDLQPLVAFGILPLFAFANTGVSLENFSVDAFLHPVPLGIAAGLFFGNQIGVFLTSWVAVKTGVAKLPQDASWVQVWGIAALCGIGFTMSLFISSLAFQTGGSALGVDDRLGIMLGSLASGLLGFTILRFAGGRGAKP